jgi:DNA helicase-2/ATP-dependent DNA helicase PcrA
MKLAELVAIIFPPGSARGLTSKQLAILQHPQGPAWVMAGPGSGKTEVLTLFVLRLLYVEGDVAQPSRVPPESIFVTTFTNKAARNLEDRISSYRALIITARPDLASIDVSKLRIGTLHGLCNDLLQEFRAPNYQNVRLMDEFEQALFVREHMSLIKQPNGPVELAFWRDFPWLFTPQQWQPTRAFPPSRWNSTHGLVKLLNRLVEDRVSIPGIKAAGGQLAVLAGLYEEYIQHLANTFRCDFSQVQGRFLDFLQSPLGKAFREGDGTAVSQGIQWVLVDEYQDTNPMQEAIYFDLAGTAPHNLVVVGDDDQAMYRFRGGSVECMVTFDDACTAYLGLPKNSVAKYDLVDNFRSHPDIVQFFDDYIRAFPVMQQPGARSPKPSIQAKKVITQTYPPVGVLAAARLEDVADRFADMVQELIDTGVVTDASECCLLLKSTKESPMNAGKYVAALQARGLELYNPRNKAFAEQEEVQCLLGSLLAIFDPQRRYAQDVANKNSIPDGEADLRATFDRFAQMHKPLDKYVSDARKAILAKPGQPLDANLQEIAYYLLGLEPFSSWLDDPVRRVRLGRLTKLLEAYNSTPVLDPNTGLPRPGVTRGFLRASNQYPGEMVGGWLNSFYHLFLGYVLNAGFDDEEDEDVICPPGRVPIMTMHQSKGLEFPFVFVGHMGESPKISASHEMETLFSAYPANPARTFTRPSAGERAEMDMIRQYYVAYSRAKYALILLGTAAHFKKQTVPLGPVTYWARQRTIPL